MIYIIYFYCVEMNYLIYDLVALQQIDGPSHLQVLSIRRQ